MKVTQLYLTLCDSMDCILPGSSVHGISQARILEWVAIPFSFLFDYFILYILILISEVLFYNQQINSVFSPTCYFIPVLKNFC